MSQKEFDGTIYRSFFPVFQDYQNRPLPVAQDSAAVTPHQLQVWPVLAQYDPLVQTFISRVRQLSTVVEVWAKVEIDAVWLIAVTDLDDPEQARHLYEIRASVAQEFRDIPIIFYHADARYMSPEHVRAEIPEDAERVYAR